MVPLLLATLFQLCSTWAAPTESNVLSIPIRDIIGGNLSIHEDHPSFKLYTRWLETPQGSYVRRDPNAAFTKHSNIASIDCHTDIGTCLLTSRVSFRDITKSERDLDNLNAALEEQLQARDEENPEALLPRGVRKRSGYADTLYSSLHFKTYHNLGEDDPVGGFQHYIVWDLKCKTVQFSSSGFQLTSKDVQVHSQNKVTATLRATLIGDTNPDTTHAVTIGNDFACGLFVNKCCVQNTWTQNWIGSKEVPVPKKEPIECYGAKDVSKQNCDAYHSGWCGVHIRQYQKNEGPGFHTENYRFDVILYDSDQELVGETELISIPSGQTQQVGSTLPYTFGVKAPDLDDDAVWMSYNGANWGSNDQEHHCDFGKYDSGHRDGDCGFTC